MILPLFSGIKVLSYPSPLHYRVIPELAYQNDVTMIFGTDTFLRNYAKAAHAYDFYKLRFAVAGAEKLKTETKELWMNKFGVRILEAYGATEAAPGLTVNSPLFSKSGTVGKFLPGIEYRLEEVSGITKGRKLYVKGPNLMKGYLIPDSDELKTLDHGWYDTGDIIDIDSEGFVTILDRVKRFAKIAGEMVSLSAIEEAIGKIDPVSLHAIIAESDERKGERLILCSNSQILDKEILFQEAKKQGLSELAIPRKIVKLDSMPLLGSGKVDYQKLKSILEAHNENNY
jgi:acyl-[acyl-carrier-protein]-phospholipid O-acyltransferase/long-chain-fatty-acid--[acyl-carrier-protein] ligase